MADIIFLSFSVFFSLLLPAGADCTILACIIFMCWPATIIFKYKIVLIADYESIAKIKIFFTYFGLSNPMHFDMSIFNLVRIEKFAGSGS